MAVAVWVNRPSTMLMVSQSAVSALRSGVRHSRVPSARAGEGYVMEDRNYPERAGAAVRVDSYEAYRDNLENNTLLKSLY